jgi:hypothetical protein
LPRLPLVYEAGIYFFSAMRAGKKIICFHKLPLINIYKDSNNQTNNRYTKTNRYKNFSALAHIDISSKI